MNQSLFFRLRQRTCLGIAAVLTVFLLGTATGHFKVKAQEHRLPTREEGDHGHGHAENHDWYQDLKQPGTGFSCCNGTKNGVEGDCRPVRADLREDGRWYALIDGRWVPVPPRVVLQQLAPDGRSHICASKSGMIHCFLGGSPKS